MVNDMPKRDIVNYDIDGTLTLGEAWWEVEPKVNESMKERLVNDYKQGKIIIIWTARQWNAASKTAGWLISNDIPFHGLYMSKGASDMYIDDKAYNAEDMI